MSPTEAPPPKPADERNFFIRGIADSFDAIGSAIHDVSAFGSRTAVDLAGADVKFFLQFPTGVLKGLADAAKNHDPALRNVMFGLHNLLGDVPVIGEYLKKEGVSYEIQSLRRLADPLQWIDAFKDTTIFTDDKVADAKSLSSGFGPVEFLKTLSLNDRKNVFREFVNKYIPQVVQAEINGKVDAGWSEEKQNAYRIEKRVEVLRAMFGGKLPEDATDPKKEDAQVKGWAQASLQEHYHLDKDGKPLTKVKDATGKDIDVDSAALWYDYQDALDRQDPTRRDLAATSVDMLQQDASSSLFLGALKLGVVMPERLQALNDAKTVEEYKKSLDEAEVHRGVEQYTQADKAEREREATTFRDTWRHLSGNEKLILFAVGGYLLATSKGIRNLAAAGVAGYFGMKFLMKVDDPIKVWSDWANKPLGAMRQFGNKWLGEWNPGYAPDLNARANVMFGFLKDFDRKNLTREAVGCTLLADVPLAVLAKNYTINPITGTGTLDVRSGGAVDDSLSKAATQYNWQAGYRNYFDEAPDESQKFVSEALSFVFYRRAAEGSPQDAETVGRGMLALPRGSSYMDLLEAAKDLTNPYESASDPKSLEYSKYLDAKNRIQILKDAAAKYRQMVAHGQDLCATDPTTLGAYVERMMGIERGKKAEKKTLEEKKDAAAMSEKDKKLVADLDGVIELKADPALARELAADPEVPKILLAFHEAEKKVADLDAEVKKATAHAALSKAVADAVEKEYDAFAAAKKAAPDGKQKEAEMNSKKAVAGLADVRLAKAEAKVALAKAEMEYQKQKMQSEACKLKANLAEAKAKAAAEDAVLKKASEDAVLEKADADAKLKYFEDVKADRTKAEELFTQLEGYVQAVVEKANADAALLSGPADAAKLKAVTDATTKVADFKSVLQVSYDAEKVRVEKLVADARAVFSKANQDTEIAQAEADAVPYDPDNEDGYYEHQALVQAQAEEAQALELLTKAQERANVQRAQLDTVKKEAGL